MTIYVYYEDDYADNGGIGLSEFNQTEGAMEHALLFIEERMKSHPKATIENYRMILGKELPLEAAQVVTKVRVKE